MRAIAQSGPGGVGSSGTNKLWFRADAVTGISDGGTITTWSDQSGNGNDATQTTAGKRPTWDQSNANFNNKPTVLFDNSDDWMDLSSFMHPSSDYTFFFVYKTVQTNKGDLFDSKSGKLEIIHEGGGDKAYKDVSAARGTEITGTASKLVCWLLDDSGASIYESGTQAQTGLTYVQSAIGEKTRLASKEGGGGGDYLQGDIAESILFNYALNSAERIIVENYLGNKYGFSITNDLFSYESVHEDDVSGIGRMDASNQNTSAESAKIFKVNNASAMGDGDYLLFGHDAGSISSYVTTESPNAEIKRIAREWRLDETGNVGTITITMDTAVLPAHASGYNGYVAMIDADGDFSSGSKIYVLTSAGGSIYNASSIGINDGDYITFGCARNVYRNTTGNFSVAANWADGSVPASSELSIIPNNATVTLSENATIGELVILNSGSLDLGSYTLYIDNNSITNNGTLTMSTGTVNYSKPGAQTIAALTYYHLSTSGSGTKTLGGNTTVNGTLAIGNSTALDVNNSQNYSLIVKGDWLNSGTFIAHNGMVTLSGSSNQAVTSDGSSFYNLIVANTATQISLNNNLTVGSTLTLTDGVITTGASYMVIISSIAASALTGFSDASFINGNLRRSVAANTETYAFPVGNGTGTSNYYRADVINNSLTGISFIVSRFKTLTGHSDSEMDVADVWSDEYGYLQYTTINTAGVWELEPDAAPTGGLYNIKLYIANMSGFTDNNFGPLKRPVGSTSGADWSTGGGLLNNNDSPGRIVSSGYMYRRNLNTFSEFGGGGGSGSGQGLPIELISFKASEASGKVELTWATATEINNDYFTVERSKDGLEFEEIRIYPGAGNSTTLKTYLTIDTNPYNGTSYYRLKQTDFDGLFSYSDIVSIFVASEINYSVAPNPVNNNRIVVSMAEPEAVNTNGSCIITDLSGRQILQQQISLKSAHDFQVDLPDGITGGIYMLIINVNGVVCRHKIVVN